MAGQNRASRWDALMSMWRWSDLFGSVPESARVSLGEGNTPLIRSRTLGPSVGLKNLYFKLDYTNPTGSYKDRFASAAISHMVAAGKKRCIATSSGNTGAALAAYCAAAGIECHIAIVEGAPMGKLKQMLAYGARLARIRKFGTDPAVSSQVFDRLNQIGQRPDWALQISAFVYSPLGMAGVQTIAFELTEQLDGRIDNVFCPAGSGGLCVAAARGFQQLEKAGRISRVPAVECVQPEGNNTVAGPLKDGLPEAQSVNCTSKVSGLQVASVIDGNLAVNECRATGGSGHLVSDLYIWEVQRLLAREEGVFAEPAGATSVAGLLQAARNGAIRADANVVCVISGSGFKDEASVDRMINEAECPVIDPEELDEW